MSEIKPEHENLRDMILEEQKKGNVVVSTFEGLMKMPLAGMIEQPVEGILYDLNRDEVTILMFINEQKWVNDYASTQVIRQLYAQLTALQSRLASARLLMMEMAEGFNKCTEAEQTEVPTDMFLALRGMNEWLEDNAE